MRGSLPALAPYNGVSCNATRLGSNGRMLRSKSLTGLAIAIALVGTCGLSREQAQTRNPWPQFRGPDGQGHIPSTGPTSWTDTEHIVWSTSIPGKGWSSPVIGSG